MIDENSYYNWLVENGQLIIFQEFPIITIRIESQNDNTCILDYKDVKDVYGILFRITSSIWEEIDKKTRPQQYEKYMKELDNNSFSWEFRDSMLILTYLKEAIEIKYEGKNNIQLQVDQATEIIQVLKYFIENT